MSLTNFTETRNRLERRAAIAVLGVENFRGWPRGQPRTDKEVIY